MRKKCPQQVSIRFLLHQGYAHRIQIETVCALALTWIHYVNGYLLRFNTLGFFPSSSSPNHSNQASFPPLQKLVINLKLQLYSQSILLEVLHAGLYSANLLSWNCTRSFLYNKHTITFVVQLPSNVQLFATPWTAACQASLSLTISQSLLKFMFIASEMPPNHLILFPNIWNFSNESAFRIR